MVELHQNLPRIRAAIAAACERSGRSPSDVTLIAVTKTHPATSIDEAFRAGILDIGENRVQEMREKADAITVRPRLHLIGHLQSNKAKEAARLFDVVHTVDSQDLAARLDRAAGALGKKLDVLIQVNVGQEEQKSGIAEDELLPLASAVGAFPSLRLAGLMTIPPALPGEEVRPFFRRLRALRDELRNEIRFTGVEHLSMGMSDDFEVAIEEGATMIRLGRALFGERS